MVFRLDDIMEPDESEDTTEQEPLSEGEFYDATIKTNTYNEDEVVLPSESPAIAAGNDRRVAQESTAEEEYRAGLLDSIEDSDGKEFEPEQTGEPVKTELDILAEEVTASEKEDEPTGFIDKLNEASKEGMKTLDALAKEHIAVANDPMTTARVLLGGIGDAAERAINFGIDVIDSIENNSIGLLGFNMLETGTKLEVMDKLVPSGGHPSEDIARGVVSFIYSFSKIDKVIGKSSKMTAAFAKTGMPVISKGMAVGAMADLLIFDPDEGNISTLLQESGGLRWPILSFLNSKKAGSRLEGRLKSVLEGALLSTGILAVETVGFLSGALIGGLKTYKSRRLFKAGVLEKKQLTEAATAKVLGTETKSIAKLETVVQDDFIKKVKALETNKTPLAVKEVTDAKSLAETVGIKLPPMNKLSPASVSEHRAIAAMDALKEGTPIPSHAGGRSIAPLKQTPEDVQRLVSTVRSFDHDNAFTGITDEEVWKEFKASKKMTVEELIAHPDKERFVRVEVLQARMIEAQTATLAKEVAESFLKGEATFSDFVKALDIQAEVSDAVKVVSAGKSGQLHAFKIEIPKNIGGKNVDLIKEINELIPVGDYRRAAYLLGNMKPEDMIDTANKARFMPILEALVEWKVNSLLSASTTFTKNITGLTLQAGLTVVESKLANTIGIIRARIHNNKDMITHTGAAQIEWKVITETMHDAFILAAEDIRVARTGKTKRDGKKLTAMRKGSAYEAAKEELLSRTKGISRYREKGRTGELVYEDEVGGSGKVDAIKTRKILGKELSFGDGNLGEVIDIIGDIVNLPITGLVTSDEFYKSMFVNMYKKRVWATKLQNYVDAGLTPEEIEKAYEFHMRDPAISKAAREYSQYLSLTNPIPGTGSHMTTSPEGSFDIPKGVPVISMGKGTMSKALESAVRAIPSSTAIIPFLNVGINAARMATERVPGLGFMLPEVRIAWSQRKENPAAWNTVLARQSLGGILMMIGIELSESNQITGSGPGNRDQYIFWTKDLGNVPNSFRVGDHWYPQSLLGPFGDVVGLGASWGEISNYSKEHEVSIQELARDIALAIGNVYEPEYLIDNLGSLTKIMREADTNAITQLLTNQPKSMVPAALQRIRRGFDPNKRITAEDKGEEGAMGFISKVMNESINKVKNAIPGWSSTLPYDTNRLGRPILYPEGLAMNAVSPIASTARVEGIVEDELNRLNMAYAPLVEKEVLKTLPNGRAVPVAIRHLAKHIKVSAIPEPIALTTEQYIMYKRLAAGLPHKDGSRGLLKNWKVPGEGVHDPIYDVLESAIKNDFPEIEASERKWLGDDYAKRSWIYNKFDEYKKKAEDQLFIELFRDDYLISDDVLNSSKGLPQNVNINRRE